MKTKEERKNTLVKLKEERHRTNGIIKAKDLQRWNDIKIAKMKRANIPERGDVANDVWAVEGKICFLFIVCLRKEGLRRVRWGG